MKPELLKLKEKRPQEDHGGLQGVTARCAVIFQPQGDDRHPERYPTNTTNTHKKRNDPIRFTDATDTALLTKVLVHNPERGCGLAEAHAELDDLLVNVAELCEEEEAHQEEKKKLHDNRKEDDEQAETMPDEAMVGMKKGEVLNSMKIIKSDKMVDYPKRTEDKAADGHRRHIWSRPSRQSRKGAYEPTPKVKGNVKGKAKIKARREISLAECVGKDVGVNACDAQRGDHL
ncbi:hypothetical protein PF011_g7555 [Phytophthora fragariae]|uniref:Uncharacterized protein n=1 Tax=Phytophthora fragariae TaxID=53985 RepID=A0A6A3L7N0_9STRA|nr:hypothetical protein PF011_g7555 [Phytophthora fragariae]